MQKRVSKSRTARGTKKRVESKKKDKSPKRQASSATGKPSKPDRLDLSNFPAESVTQMERGICLACVWKVFTRQLKLAPKTALGEIKRYAPSLDELNAATIARP